MALNGYDFGYDSGTRCCMGERKGKRKREKEQTIYISPMCVAAMTIAALALP